jgi:PIN domain nuclease of toxin-antitoxin system
MILLDTHALVWLASDSARLSSAARQAIQSHPKSLHISIVTAWEISLLVKRGRLKLPLSPGDYFTRAVAHHGLIEMPLTRRVAQHSVDLPDIHNDPFDRILIAECQNRGLSLVSCDTTLSRYPNLNLVW